MIFPLFLLGDSILAVWLEAEFAEKATLILRIFCVRYALTPMGIVNYNYLLAAGLVKYQALIVGLVAPTTILGMFILIPAYGAVGAATAHLLSLPYMLFSRFLIEKKLFNEVNVRGNLSYFLPVIVPFGAATFLMLEMPIRISSIFPLVLAIGVLAAVGGGFSLLLGQLCRRLGWMPS
jgi:O-antigen/teichoic acid export membrane protein